MSKPEEFVSVQPQNTTAIEEALEYAWDQLITGQSDPYPMLKQPLYTADEFVALLAGERGVFDWQPNDSIAQQRQTANQAFAIHRSAGTRSGLRLSLGVIDSELEVTPWYQVDDAPGPYYLKCVAWRKHHPITKALTERLLSRIEHVKSERDSVDLYMAFGLESSLGLGGATSRPLVIDDVSRQGKMPPVAPLYGPLGLGGAMSRPLVIDDDSRQGKMPPVPVLQGSLALGGAVSRPLVIEDEGIHPSKMPPVPVVQGSLALGGGVRSILIKDESRQGKLPQFTDCEGGIYLKGATYQVNIYEDEPSPLLPNFTACAGTLSLSGASHMTVITDLEPTAI